MKNALLLFLMVIFLSNLSAQDSGSNIVFNRFYIGAKAGYGTVEFNSTDLSITKFAERTYRNISYGLVTGFKVSPRFTIQAEGVYAQYGANNILYDHVYSASNPLLTSYSSTTSVDHVDMDLYYIDIPLTFQYSLSEGDFAPYVYAGANWAINVLGYTTIVRAIADQQGTIYREFNDGITEQLVYYEFAPVGGVGVNLNIGRFTLFGDARFKYGIMNLSNVKSRLGFTNNALWLSAGLTFGL
jgi:hypothetical protein